MAKFVAWRIIGSKPGCVDFLTEIEAESEQAAEDRRNDVPRHTAQKPRR
jgi:hypothetical protein